MKSTSIFLRYLIFIYLLFFTLISCSSLKDAEKLNNEGKKDEAIEVVEPYLKSGDPKERKKALKILGDIGGEKAGALAATLLKDPNKDVQIQSLKSVGKIKYSPASETLVDLVGYVNGEVAEALAKSIASVGKIAADLLVRNFGSNKADNERYKKMLISVGPVVTNSIVESLEGKSFFENRYNFEVLVALKNPGVAKLMVPYLEKDEVAYLVVDGLTNLGSLAVDPVIEFLKLKMKDNETADKVMEKLVKILGNLKDQRAIPILDKLEKTTNERISVAVDEAIKKIRGF